MPTKNYLTITALMDLYDSRIATGNNDMNGNVLYTVTATAEELLVLNLAASILRDQDILITMLDGAVPAVLR